MEVENLNEYMGIPSGFDFIKDSDMNQMATYAMAEAESTYPVPQLWSKEKLVCMYRKIKEN